MKHTEVQFRAYNTIHKRRENSLNSSHVATSSLVIISSHVTLRSSSVSDRSASSFVYTQYGWHGIHLFPASLQLEVGAPHVQQFVCLFFLKGNTFTFHVMIISDSHIP